MGSLRVLATLLLCYQTVTAQTVQSSWAVPNGSLSDFAQTFTEGKAMPIAWDGWDSGWTDEFLDNDTVADLWVTSYNYAQYEYSQYLVGNVNISVAGSYNWTINVNSTSLSNTAEYVFRFKPPQSTYNVSSDQISSTGFIVVSKDTTTTTTATTSAPTSTTTSASSTTAATATASATATSSASASSSSSGLSSGAKAGIGVGVSIGAIAILTALAFLFRRRNLTRKSAAAPVAPAVSLASPPPQGPSELDTASKEAGKQVLYSPVPVHELPSYPAHPAELDSGDYP
ncbi:hypothetical protein UA08_05252 [Talaromyces atroroseus]|uniref:Mid2 domain-containing protein n=1 Tax=Talaromyces atroroseus TaxID=1441469 RepID=A0A225AUW1_TALAT|nr:hypothetical protein UA08_05252 [Talaromyces atroroseus]OKL59379.1 hypothetical protein UA08_05252 [Talaromyces atroroseus]